MSNSVLRTTHGLIRKIQLIQTLTRGISTTQRSAIATRVYRPPIGTIMTVKRAHATATTSTAAEKNETNRSNSEIEDFQQSDACRRKDLQEEAAFLTKSLYRTCLRSIKLIRPGNVHDEEEFERREEQRRIEEEASFSSRRSNNDDIRMGLFSMLPPVDREDELRSRAEYYHQYTRENFVQEKDCVPLGDKTTATTTAAAMGQLQEQHIEKFLYLLEKGEKDRQWLLQDMMFQDPYKGSFPKQRIQEFEKKAIAYIQESRNVQTITAGTPFWDEDLAVVGDDDDDDEADDDSGLWDDDGEEVPEWLRKKFPEYAPKH